MFYINAIHHGGAERVMVNLAEQFAAIGVECILVTSFVDEWEYPVPPSVTRISLYEKMIRGFARRNLRLTASLRRLVRKEKPDLLITFMAEPNFRGLLACIGQKTKNLISIRNDPEREYPNRVSRLLAKFLFRRADGIVFQTEDAKNWFPKKIQKKSRVILNQVDERFYTTAHESQEKRIVTTGRLVAQKNHRLLIEAFADVADQIEESLWIYGDGPLKNGLSSLIEQYGLQDRVFLPGATTNVPAVLAAAEIFVLSSDYEGLPNALMEAMAMGLPCISTDCPCGGPRALMEHSQQFLVPVGDRPALSQAILSLATDAGIREAASAANRIDAQRFRPETVFDEWRKFAELLTANH